MFSILRRIWLDILSDYSYKLFSIQKIDCFYTLKAITTMWNCIIMFRSLLRYYTNLPKGAPKHRILSETTGCLPENLNDLR